MNKKYIIGIIVVLVAIVAVIFIFFQRDNVVPSAIDNSVSENLYPEQAISHGHGLAVDTNDSDKLYIATHYGLLTLAGDKKLYRIGKGKNDLMGFSILPYGTNVMFASGHSSVGDNLGFQKSEDGGITWKKVSDGVNGPVDFHSMAISPKNPNLIYGWYQGNLQRSGDQGKTWEIVNRDLLPLSLVADSQDENIVYATDSQSRGILISRDKGATWSSLSAELEGGAVSVVSVSTWVSEIIFVFSEKLGGMGASSDGGATWKKVNENFDGGTVSHIVFSWSKPNIVYAMTRENKLYKSEDTGDNWIKIYEP